MPDLSGCLLLAALLIFSEDVLVRRAEGAALTRGLASLSDQDNVEDTRSSPVQGQGDATVSPPSSGTWHWFILIFSIQPQHQLRHETRILIIGCFHDGLHDNKGHGALLTAVSYSSVCLLFCRPVVEMLCRAMCEEVSFF